MTGSSFQGVLKILRFNWPWYALALLGDLLAALMFHFGFIPAEVQRPAIVAVGIGNLWLIGSLAVSHWIYDRSPISKAAWALGLNSSARRVAVFHAGQDEASAAVAHHFSAAELLVFDFFDPDLNREPSLMRARALAGGPSAPSVQGHALPLPDGHLDLAFLIFTAHEVRDQASRERFFAELGRVLTREGTLVLVEHLRDAWNGLAYGPGAYHFLARETWIETFRNAGLILVGETHHTPFVRAFHLRRSA